MLEQFSGDAARRKIRAVFITTILLGVLTAIIGAIVGYFVKGSSAIPQFAIVCGVIGAAVTAILAGLGAAQDRKPGLQVERAKHFYIVPVRPNLSTTESENVRNHIICLDGTWNDESDKTNIFQLSELLLNDGKSQVVSYYPGVGVQKNKGVAVRLWRKAIGRTVLGAVSGLGALKLKRQVYLEFVRNYQLGDRVFLFGFSRGAAIARMLATYIHENGIPEAVEAKYQRNPLGDDQIVDFAVIVPHKCARVEIEMMGLFDTVTSFGLPWNKVNLFTDFRVAPNVKKVYHLVAIDEKRKTFDITLMKAEDRINEIWFAGAHTNVGGGFKDTRLADITLRFMARKASDCKLQFAVPELQWGLPCDTGRRQIAGSLWAPGWMWRWRIHRQIRVEGGPPGCLPRIHESVTDRMSADNSYSPPNIKRLNNAFIMEHWD